MEPVMRVNHHGDQEWMVRGKYHRIDGPAVIRADGTQAWCVNGLLHRTDGPAFISPDGDQSWYTNGEFHRVDGPAIIWHNGDQDWIVRGEDITQEVNDWMRKQKVTWPWDAETQALFVLTFT
jgi:hypothetical protein